MSAADTTLAKLRALPPDQQRVVVEFIDFLAEKAKKKRPYPNLRGICADLGIDITEEDFREARREMWGNFPREDIL